MRALIAFRKDLKRPVDESLLFIEEVTSSASLSFFSKVSRLDAKMYFSLFKSAASLSRPSKIKA